MSTIRANIITDRLGTGAPDFPNGIEVAGGALAGLADQAEAEAGIDNTKLMTPLRTAQAVAANIVLSKFFESAEQTILEAGSLTLAHGLGAVPKLIVPLLICKTAEGGFSVNDVVFINPNIHSSNQGASIVPDATNINIRFGLAKLSAYRVIHNNNGISFDITNDSWRFIVRAWA